MLCQIFFRVVLFLLVFFSNSSFWLILLLGIEGVCSWFLSAWYYAHPSQLVLIDFKLMWNSLYMQRLAHMKFYISASELCIGSKLPLCRVGRVILTTGGGNCVVRL